MAHFAEIDSNNKVIQVVVVGDAADEVFCQQLFNSNNRWLKTSYNTHAGQHRDGGVPFRKNFAGIGYTYDEELDAFIPPRAIESWTSWVLNEETCQWEAPIPKPPELPWGIINKSVQWNESLLQWVVIDDPSPDEIGPGRTAYFDMENCVWIIEDIVE
jgi:hypothetical protein